MKAVGQYLLAVVASVIVVGAIAWAFVDVAGRNTVLASAAAVVAVQMSAFLITRFFQKQNVLLGWGLGSVLRMVALVLYAVVVARLWRAPVTPALLSFVAMLFVTTVLEPVFLRR